MVEQGISEQSGGDGGGNLAMASSSTSKQNPLLNNEYQKEVVMENWPLPMKEPSLNYHPYPPPLAKYEDVMASPKLFMDTLEKLHSTMGTKFMIPIIGGKALDLHLLFVEVTSRGGIEKVLGDRRWKEVTAVFSFPSSATNASFILRKYFFSLLHHYEQIYFFKAKGWTTSHADALRNESTGSAPPTVLPSPETQAAAAQPQRRNTAELPESSGPPTVNGVIDGKFESGYLVTVTIGSEKLKGVLYQTPQSPAHQYHQVSQYQNVFPNKSDNSTPASGVLRRRRRKKSEIKKRDPAHPKPNRSGYNFFFAEQRARLKPLYPEKDREISRMIGELWNKIQEPEKAVYQEKAARDKERYIIEMEDYKKTLEMDHIIRDAVPIQQRPLEPNVNMMEHDERTETEVADSPHTPGNEKSSAKSEKNNLEDDRTADKDSDMGTSPGAEIDAENLSIGSSTDEETFELKRRRDIGGECKEFLVDVQAGTEKDSSRGEEKESGLLEERESVPSEERELNPNKVRESVFDVCP